MLKEDPEFFVETFRMTPAGFDFLLSTVGPRIKKEGNLRESITPAERLQMTLV